MLSFLFLPAFCAFASEEKELGDYSLEELLNVKVGVASEYPMTPREAPGVLTIVSGREIRDSGARDLIDVLRLIPGFDFGMDVLGVTGAGFRGVWGHEGKILLRIDGHDLNERMYTNFALGNHFPVELIQRIEVIRGPGSAMYGGFAELAVINIVTMIGSELDGYSATNTFGATSRSFARENLALAGGKTFDDLYVGASLFWGLAKRSDKEYADFSGARFDLADSNRLEPLNVIAAIRWKKLKASFLLDDYDTTHRDGYTDVIPETPNTFAAYHASLSYEHDLTDRWTMTPEFRFSSQKPWHNTSVLPTDPAHYDATADHFEWSLKSTHRWSDRFHLVNGGSFSYDNAEYGPTSLYVFANGEKESSYVNFALFSEGTLNTWANLTAGLRFERHSRVGSSLVPRVGVTKTIDPFHMKLLYSRAFRAPGFEQIRLGRDIKPETTDIGEAEVGYRFLPGHLLTANYFEIHISDPIVFTFDTVNNTDAYLNLDQIHTRGVETEYKVDGKRGYAALSYSFYVPIGSIEKLYEVPGSNDLLLGFPAHKFTAYGSLVLYKGLRFNPSFVLTSTRHGVSQSFGPNTVFNLYLLYKDLLISGFDVGVGAFNLTDDAPPFVQPYDGGHAPLPQLGREYLARISYEWR
jgi:outer membrane receptor protein involved in Fe transport